jgi:5-methylcytosine-specific restriction endonuclease McrA
MICDSDDALRPHGRAKAAAAHRPRDMYLRRSSVTVWKRDGGRCAFVGADGRCTERGLLELHHLVPFAEGGPTTSANLQLRCRAHNAYEAQQYFGEWLLSRPG